MQIPLRESGMLLMQNRIYMPSIFDVLMGENRTPATNVASDDKEYKIQILAAGFEKEDIKVLLDEDELSVTMNCKEEGNQRYFTSGSYHRRFSIPEDANRENIAVSLKNGTFIMDLIRKDGKVL